MSELQELTAMFKQFMGLQVAQLKHDAAGTPNYVPSHGPVQGTNQFGLFATPGLTPDGNSTLVRPASIAALVAARLVRQFETAPIRWTMTGQNNDIVGSNPDDTCSDPVAFGLTKACRQSRQFGRAFFKTREVSFDNLDLIRDVADAPINLLNSPMAQPNPLLPTFPLPGTGGGYNNSYLKINNEAFIGFERSLSHVLINGDISLTPAQAQPGFITEFVGLAAQIKTGHVDVLDPTIECPAVDSIVINWGADLGASATAATDTRDFVKMLGDTMYSLETNARKFGNTDPGWSLVMHPDLWREIVGFWPCNFDTTRCKTAITTPREELISINIDPNTQQQIRQGMIDNLAITIDGKSYPVTLDDSMTRTTVSQDVYRFDLLIVPWNQVDAEYKPMDGPEAAMVMNAMPPGTTELWNNAMWVSTQAQTLMCMFWAYTMQMRLHLKTPQLAAKITNIQTSSFVETRDPFPGQSRYLDGGTVFGLS